MAVIAAGVKYAPHWRVPTDEPWCSMEVSVVKVLVEKDSFLANAKRQLNTAQNWIQRRVLKPAGKFVDTVNGQKVLDEVSAYMTENEAINTALVTRVLQAESRIRWLQALVAMLAVAEAMHWLLR